MSGLKERTGIKLQNCNQESLSVYFRHQNQPVFSSYCLSTHRHKLGNVSHQGFKYKERGCASKTGADFGNQSEN